MPMYVGFIADFDHRVILRESCLKGKDDLEKLADNFKMADLFSTETKFSEKLLLLTP